MGSKSKAFIAPATPSEKEEAKVTDHFLLRGKIPGGAFYSPIFVPAEGYLAV